MSVIKIKIVHKFLSSFSNKCIINNYLCIEGCSVMYDNNTVNLYSAISRSCGQPLGALQKKGHKCTQTHATNRMSYEIKDM